MTKGSISTALRLTGDYSIYPNSVPWTGTITFDFMDHAPEYYPLGFYTRNVSTDTSGQHRAVDEEGLFRDVSAIGRPAVTLAASQWLGDDTVSAAAAALP